jgi:hypothetical protein
MAGRRIALASHARGGWGGSVAQGGRHPERVGLEWEKVGPGAGPAMRISKETTWDIKVNWAELTMGFGKLFSQFSNKDLGFKIKDFKFQTKIELGQTRINSNKLFEYFSNLQLLKISFEYSNLNQDFQWKTSKLIKKKISKRNLNLFKNQNRPRARK